MAIGADLNEPDCVGESLLIAAAHKGDLKAVSLLLDYGVDVNVTDSLGETALCASIYNDQKEIARLLLGSGADPLIGSTLCWAVRRNFMPDWMIPCIGMIEPDSELANRLAHDFLRESYRTECDRWYLNLSRPYIDACLDKITNQAKLKELFQEAVEKCRVSVVQALLERGCSWSFLNVGETFVVVERRSYHYSMNYPQAMVEFINMGILEGLTPDEVKYNVLYHLRMGRKDVLYDEVLKIYEKKQWEKTWENIIAHCNIS